VYRPRVYTASKLHHYPYWLQLRDHADWDFIEWTASWPGKLQKGLEATSTPTEFANHWSQDIREIRESDFVLIKFDDGLRGALVEAGAGIAFGLKIVAAGFGPGDTWTYHPQVIRVYNMDMARKCLYQYTTMVPPASRKRLKDD